MPLEQMDIEFLGLRSMISQGNFVEDVFVNVMTTSVWVGSAVLSTPNLFIMVSDVE